MSPQGLLKGEELEINGFVATVAHTYGGGVWLTVGDAGGRIFIDDAAYAELTVTHKTPAPPVQWPPKPGDVWLDSQGNPWWARQVPSGLHMTPSTGGRAMPECQWLDVCGPPILAWRVGYEMPTGPQPVLTEQQHADLLDRLRAHGKPVTADEPVSSQTPVTDALAAAGWIEPDKRPYYEKAFDDVGDSVTANGQRLADAGPADEPGGWMRPGEGSIYTQGPAEACADEPPAETVEPDVEMVSPWEIRNGDVVRVQAPWGGDVTVVDHDNSRDRLAMWFEDSEGNEHEYVVHHGGAVARVRKAAKARTIRAGEVRPGDVIQLSKLTLEHTVKAVEPVDDGERVRYVLEDDGPWYSFADAQVWLVRRGGESR